MPVGDPITTSARAPSDAEVAEHLQLVMQGDLIFPPAILMVPPLADAGEEKSPDIRHWKEAVTQALTTRNADTLKILLGPATHEAVAKRAQAIQHIFETAIPHQQRFMVYQAVFTITTGYIQYLSYQRMLALPESTWEDSANQERYRKVKDSYQKAWQSWQDVSQDVYHSLASLEEFNKCLEVLTATLRDDLHILYSALPAKSRPTLRVEGDERERFRAVLLQSTRVFHETAGSFLTEADAVSIALNAAERSGAANEIDYALLCYPDLAVFSYVMQSRFTLPMSQSLGRDQEKLNQVVGHYDIHKKQIEDSYAVTVSKADVSKLRPLADSCRLSSRISEFVESIKSITSSDAAKRFIQELFPRQLEAYMADEGHADMITLLVKHGAADSTSSISILPTRKESAMQAQIVAHEHYQQLGFFAKWSNSVDLSIFAKNAVNFYWELLEIYLQNYIPVTPCAEQVRASLTLYCRENIESLWFFDDKAIKYARLLDVIALLCCLHAPREDENPLQCREHRLKQELSRRVTPSKTGASGYSGFRARLYAYVVKWSSASDNATALVAKGREMGTIHDLGAGSGGHGPARR